MNAPLAALAQLIGTPEVVRPVVLVCAGCGRAVGFYEAHNYADCIRNTIRGGDAHGHE